MIGILKPSDAGYPGNLSSSLNQLSSQQLVFFGDPAILRRRTLALFCSVKCPGDVILKTYDLAKQLRDAGIAVVGGFHSPMEKEVLRVLLRGEQPTVVCPARSIESMRIPAEWRKPIDDGRMLILSPFDGKHKRATAELAAIRNEFVAALADAIFIAHAQPGGHIDALCEKATQWEKPIITFDERDPLSRIASTLSK